jgi:hypothetical protein
MGRACSIYGRDEKYKMLVRKHEEKRQCEDLGIDEKIL